MSTSKLNYATDKNSAHISTLNSRMFLRKQAVKYSPKTHSVFCCTGEENISLSLVITDSIHHKLQKMVLCDFQLMARLEVALDDIVGNVKYHGLCLLKQTQPEEPGSTAETKVTFRTCRGQAVLPSDYWNHFLRYLQ